MLSCEQLLSHVWGYDYDPGSTFLEVYVGYLRGKVGTDGIATVRGMGYAWLRFAGTLTRDRNDHNVRYDRKRDTAAPPAYGRHKPSRERRAKRV